MLAKTFDLDVSYGQIAIYRADLLNPFNDWSDAHVSQGFAWRKGSVSFRTISAEGPHTIELIVESHMGTIDPSTVRAIDVPFDVPPDGRIEVASISDAVAIQMTPGTYCLRCGFMAASRKDKPLVRITFAKEEVPRFAIARCDNELIEPKTFITTATPATSRG